MGYRSAVAYTIRFVPPFRGNQDVIPSEEEDMANCKDSFYTFLADAKANTDTALCFNEEEPINVKDGKEGFFVDEEKLEIRFLAWHVKWYPDYPDVQCHDALFSLASEWANDNDYIGGASVRIGEEIDDNDTSYFGTGDNEWLEISRHICMDGKEL